jgi:hypothetical protein
MVQLILAALLATTPLAADSTASAPRLVRLLTVEGVPPDTALHGEFMRGFDEALASPTLAVERRNGSGEWHAAEPFPNRFRFTADPAEEHAWTLQLVVGAPPPFASTRDNKHTHDRERHVDPKRRASRGMTVAILVLSPEAIAGGARAMPEHLAFFFPLSAAPSTRLDGVPTGYLFPWRDAGRTAATLALELLHHRSGDLPEEARCILSPAERAESTR